MHTGGRMAHFYRAYRENQEAAMKCTVMDMMHLMGFHYAGIGSNKVEEMCDFAMMSEYNQVPLPILNYKQSYL